MILTFGEKAPPPYTRQANSFRSPRTYHTRLNHLPVHILLQVIRWTSPDGISLEERRFVLYWMSSSLRYVCRNIWIATMHILRTSYLPLYTSHVLPPFTSDAFPIADIATHGAASGTELVARDSDPATSIISTRRETAIFDLFILIRSRQDMRSDESDLYLDTEDERYRDMFNFMQPRARLEDLVLKYGLRYDLIALPSSSPSCYLPPYSTPSPSYTALPTPPSAPCPMRKTSFSDISVTWGNRVVSLCAKDPQGKRRVLVETTRDKNETLESIARRMVGEWWRTEEEIASRRA